MDPIQTVHYKLAIGIRNMKALVNSKAKKGAKGDDYWWVYTRDNSVVSGVDNYCLLALE